MKITEETIQQMIRLKKQGKTLEEVGDEMGVSSTTVRNYLKENMEDYKKHLSFTHITEDDIQRIIQLRRKRLSYKDISVITDINPSTIKKYLKKHMEDYLHYSPTLSLIQDDGTQRRDDLIIAMRRRGWSREKVCKKLRISETYLVELEKKIRGDGIYIPYYAMGELKKEFDTDEFLSQFDFRDSKRSFKERLARVIDQHYLSSRELVPRVAGALLWWYVENLTLCNTTINDIEKVVSEYERNSDAEKFIRVRGCSRILQSKAKAMLTLHEEGRMTEEEIKSASRNICNNEHLNCKVGIEHFQSIVEKNGSADTVKILEDCVNEIREEKGTVRNTVVRMTRARRNVEKIFSDVPTKKFTLEDYIHLQVENIRASGIADDIWDDFLNEVNEISSSMNLIDFGSRSPRSVASAIMSLALERLNVNFYRSDAAKMTFVSETAHSVSYNILTGNV